MPERKRNLSKNKKDMTIKDFRCSSPSSETKKEKLRQKLSTQNSVLYGLSVIFKGEIKSLHEKNRLREFMTTNSSLQKILEYFSLKRSLNTCKKSQE